jgi:hypothetical protein
MPVPTRRLLPNGTKELRRRAAAMLLYLQSAVSPTQKRFPKFSRIGLSSHIEQVRVQTICGAKSLLLRYNNARKQDRS